MLPSAVAESNKEPELVSHGHIHDEALVFSHSGHFEEVDNENKALVSDSVQLSIHFGDQVTEYL